MQRMTTERSDQTKPGGLGEQDSPAIQKRIEELDSDLAETRQRDCSLK
jgi:hypothetical protein